MFDDLEALFLENALTAYNDFSKSLKTDTLGQSTDLRLGMNAATSLYHFREHVPVAHRKSRAALAAMCSDYDLLGDLVNAGKHREVTRGTPRVRSAADIREIVVVTEYEDANGPYQHERKTVEVALADGSMRELKDILRSVVDLWIAELKAIGLLASLKPASRSRRPRVPRRKTLSGTGVMKFVARKGERFHVTYRREKYNYATGRAEPVDITGHNYVMNVYKPPTVEIEFAMVHKESGRRIQRTVKLSDKQSAAFRALKTDAERAKFGNTIAAKHRDLMQELAREAAATSTAVDAD